MDTLIIVIALAAAALLLLPRYISRKKNKLPPGCSGCSETSCEIDVRAEKKEKNDEKQTD